MSEWHSFVGFLAKILFLTVLLHIAVASDGYRSDVGGHRASKALEERYGMSYKLHNQLFRHYKKRVRPVKHPNMPVDVTMTVFIYQVIKIDPVKNTINMLGSFELYWNDQFLSWSPQEFGNATQIFVSSKDIWTPEMSLYYSHNFNEAVVLRPSNDVRLNYTGNMRFYVPFTTESICQIDVKMFPFDTQECTLYFGSWAHSNESITFGLYENELNLIDFYDNQEWQLLVDESTVKRVPTFYNYTGEELYWDFIHITVKVKRQSFYYVFNLVVPSTIITIVAVVGFHTPSTSGRVRDAKFRLGIMTLMSMSVLLLAIVEDMPKFSIQSGRQEIGANRSDTQYSGVPLIGLLYFCLLTIIGVSTITTSMFVFLERSVRIHRNIPWYLTWLAYNRQGYRLAKSGSVTVVTRVARKKVSTCATVRGATAMQKYDEVLDSSTSCSNSILQQTQNLTARQELKKRLSIGQYDNLIVYQYFHQAIEDLIDSIINIEKSLNTIRHELLSLLPQDDLDNLWALVIRRLELLSLSFYLGLVFLVMILFFWHDWYDWIS